VKTTALTIEQLTAAEASCSRVLAGAASAVDKQKALFYRGLMRFLQVMQKGMASVDQADGSVRYSPASLSQVQLALADIEPVIASDSPMKGDEVIRDTRCASPSVPRTEGRQTPVAYGTAPAVPLLP
jgi:hypothetical protein